MSGGPQYTLYHPRWFRRRMSVWWWLKNPAYTGFVLRELTCVFVAFFALSYLCELRAIAKGAEAYAQFLAYLKTAPFLILNAVAFVFVLLHSITWFNLAPKAMVVRLGSTRVPDGLIIAMNYAAWIVLSAAVAFILVRG